MTPEEIKARNREAQRRFRERNPAHYKNYHKNYYEKNREACIRKSVEWGRKNKFRKHELDETGKKRRAAYLKPAQAWIAQARHEAGITQRELAERCGVSLRVVRAWEQGITKAKDELIKEALKEHD